jgi:hypothetical protein
MNVAHGIDARPVRYTGAPVPADFGGQYGLSRIGVLPQSQQKRIMAKFRRFFRSVVGDMKWRHAIASRSEMF